MAVLERVQRSFRRLQRKLTFSYTAFMLGALLFAVLILGMQLFLTLLAPLEFMHPEWWVNIFSESI